jgi:ABC-type sugar transport system ATPase subunit
VYAIQARGLTKSFKGVRAVDELNLIVEGGDTVALLGSNWAGKTTTLMMLLGIVEPDAGSLELLVVRRHYYVTIHSPTRLIELGFWPIVDLVLWGLIRTASLSTTGDILVLAGRHTWFQRFAPTTSITRSSEGELQHLGPEVRAVETVPPVSRPPDMEAVEIVRSATERR